jgi:hypothetical protein
VDLPADIIYLKQDFSTMLAVAKHGLWPALQRFATGQDVLESILCGRELSPRSPGRAPSGYEFPEASRENPRRARPVSTSITVGTGVAGRRGE